MSEREGLRTNPSIFPRLRDWRDDKAWRWFHTTYGSLIAAWLRRERFDDVEDITQEVLLKVARLIRDEKFVYDPRQTFRGYLRTAVQNTLRDHRKRRARRPVEEAVGGGAGQEILEREAPWLDQLEAEWEEQWRLGQVAAARVRAQVEPSSWEAFERTAIKGESGALVAARLGLSVAAVYKARQRVAEKLREAGARLQHEHPESP